jgi:peptide chain release factor 2
MQERSQLESHVNDILALENKLAELVDMIEIAESENESELVAESEKELAQLLKAAERHQLKSFLSGEADNNNAFLEVNAGAGGTEAQDWAEMLFRMYSRWAEKEKYKLEIIQENSGEVAGIKSATLKISGPKAFGWLRTESGVHRLVRISPFDSNARRHTSFSAVRVYPELDESIEIAIEDKDLKVDTFRASGAGGQHVNTTDSAIRITHMPTGIVVQCQNDRSQHRNRAQAMQMLKSRLYELELRKQEEKAMSTHAQKSDNAWGNQIRSYVLQPYQMVKDLRTGVETSNTQGVLDGDINAFLEAALAHRATNQR